MAESTWESVTITYNTIKLVMSDGTEWVIEDTAGWLRERVDEFLVELTDTALGE